MTDLTITLDLRKSDNSNRYCLRLGDKGRIMKIRIRDGERNFVPEGVYAALTAKKPNGALVYQDCTWEDGVLLTPITAQLTAISGEVACELRLTDGQGGLLTTGRFFLDISRVLYHDRDGLCQNISSSRNINDQVRFEFSKYLSRPLPTLLI